MNDEEAETMSGVAKMRVIIGDNKPEARAEELRILEALLFAAEEPLDEKILAKRFRRARRACPVAPVAAGIAPRGVDLVHVGGNGRCGLRATSPGC